MAVTDQCPFCGAPLNGCRCGQKKQDYCYYSCGTTVWNGQNTAVHGRDCIELQLANSRQRTAYLEEAVRVRDQRATTFYDNDGIMRVVTCMYCGARLCLGDPHCGFCETVTHPLKGKEDSDE